MIWRVLVLLVLLASSAEATERFVDNNGNTSGTCTSSSPGVNGPCRLSYALPTFATAGEIFTLLSNTYQGANNMLNLAAFVPGVSGTAGNLITVRAQTDGGVFIDGQFARAAFVLEQNNFWSFTGFDVGNVASGAPGGFAAVGQITDSKSTEIRRICFSNIQNDNVPNNQHVIMVWNSQNILLEDVCAFGYGRNTLNVFTDGSSAHPQASLNNIFRRLWLRYEGYGSADNAMGVQSEYYDDFTGTTPNSGGDLYENIILVYSSEQRTALTAIPWFSHRVWSTPISRRGIIIYGLTGAPTIAANLQWYRDFQNVETPNIAYTSNLVDMFVDGLSQPSATNVAPFYLDGCGGDSRCASNSANRLTGIRTSSGGTSTFGYPTVTNQNECTSLAGCPNFYTGDNPGTGARNCFRYSGGTLTSTPLWPWPMDDRIKAALARAKAAGTGGSDLAGTALAGAYAANTVTSEIVSRYGSVPTACLAGSSFTPAFPVASDFPSVAVLDTFDRANSGTLGANWTSLLADVFSIVSNQASAPSTGSAFARSTYSGNQITGSFHEVYATWTVLPATGGYTTLLSFAGTDLTVNNQYRVRVNRTTGVNTLVEVRRVDGSGTETVILAGVDLGIEAVDTNSFGVRVSGSTISVYWKWTDGIWYRVGQFTDANLPTGNVYGGMAGGSPAVINDFGAGPAPTNPPTCPPVCPPNPAAVTGSGVGRFGNTFPGVH